MHRAATYPAAASGRRVRAATHTLPSPSGKRRLLLLRRQRVEIPQQRAAIRVLIVHTADAVQYMPVAVQQKEIQPFAHEFKHKRFLPAAVQLVHGIQPQDKQPLAEGLFQP